MNLVSGGPSSEVKETERGGKIKSEFNIVFNKDKIA